MTNPNVDRAARQRRKRRLRSRRPPRSREPSVWRARLQLHRITRPARRLVAAEGEGAGLQRPGRRRFRRRRTFASPGGTSETRESPAPASVGRWPIPCCAITSSNQESSASTSTSRSATSGWRPKRWITSATYPTTFLDDAGTSAKSALRVVRKIGVLKTSVLPFEGGLVKLKEAHFLKVAGRLKVKAFFNLCGTQAGKLDRFKEWLAFHGPILTRLKVDPSWNTIKADGQLRKYESKKANGGHAVAIVGFTPAHFIIRNSWGVGWGHKGFAYASYEYAADAFHEAYGIVI